MSSRFSPAAPSSDIYSNWCSFFPLEFPSRLSLFLWRREAGTCFPGIFPLFLPTWCPGWGQSFYQEFRRTYKLFQPRFFFHWAVLLARRRKLWLSCLSKKSFHRCLLDPVDSYQSGRQKEAENLLMRQIRMNHFQFTRLYALFLTSVKVRQIPILSFLPSSCLNFYEIPQIFGYFILWAAFSDNKMPFRNIKRFP